VSIRVPVFDAIRILPAEARAVGIPTGCCGVIFLRLEFDEAVCRELVQLLIEFVLQFVVVLVDCMEMTEGAQLHLERP